MKRSLAILCVEDEPEVLESVIRDLEMFEEVFRLEAASSAGDAMSLLDKLNKEGVMVALFICDHLMPDQTGVEFMINLNNDPAYVPSAKMLLTGQAGLDDTVKALNEGGLDYYLAKPWNREQFQETVKKLLTGYVAKNVKNVLPYLSILDAELLSESMRGKNTLTDF